jgi:CPA2 family monovalent cation:H+ antiporter-2
MHLPITLSSTTGVSGANLVRDMLVILGAAALISILLRRLRLASIPGYLIVGALLGSLPAGWGLVSHGDNTNVEQIQEIAIILLMFTIGLHLEVEAISSGMVPILLVGAASTVGSTLALWPLGMAFGLRAPSAMAVAMALSMSSTAVVLGLLQQRKEVHLLHGRLCIGISIMQDLLSIAALALLPLLAVWAGIQSPDAADADGTTRLMQLVSHSSLAVGGIILMLAFAHYLLPHLLREASRDGNTEALLVVSAGTGLAAAVLTAKLGFGPALGAFLAGFMLSSTPFKYQLAGQLSPMRDLFMAVFFTAVGVQLDVPGALHSWWIVLAAVVLTMGVKSFTIGLSAWLGGATAVIAGLTGLLLSQAGEFSLVILAEAGKLGVLPAGSQGVIVPLVVISLMLTEPAAGLAHRLSPWLARIKPARWLASPALRERPHAHVPTDATGAGWARPDGMGGMVAARRHVIVAGFGVVGRNLAEHFAAREIPYTVIELNPDTVLRQQRLGRTTVFGDATNPEVLESAGLGSAEAVVLTIPDDEATVRACRVIRARRPDVFIAVRAGYLGRAMAAHESGADHVTIEEVVTAQDMAVKVVAELERRFAAQEKQTPHL